VGLYDGVNGALRAQQTTATIAVIQLGTLVAVLIYFAGDILNITIFRTRPPGAGHRRRAEGQPMSGSAPTGGRLSHDALLGWLVIIGSIPVAVVGLLFKKQIEGTFTKNLWVIATMMIIIAILLGLAELVGKRTRSMKDLGIFDALVVGFAQCLALIPVRRGLARLSWWLFAGEMRETAARFISVVHSCVWQAACLS
jgi:undecaprenyl-diphosphatase